MVVVVSQFAIWGAFVCYGADAGKDSSLSESKIENADTKVTAAALLSQNAELQKAACRWQQESVQDVDRKSGGIECRGGSYFAESFRICSCGWKRSGWNRRTRIARNWSSACCTAVSDLQLQQKERDQYRDQMLRLSEAVLAVFENVAGRRRQGANGIGNATARRRIDCSGKRMRATPAQTGRLMDGSVISVKEEWSLVVGNFGEKQGVKMGMPLRVMRGDRLIATLGWWTCARKFAVR